ncbi:MAG: LysM peptidoglycan-binding domain-containing protein [Chlamydiae bacterium]|nr:LysM peptidoglycan-binding domain-containing protein [Chlamydiota bacterium]
MSRRDTIVISVLVNMALLVVLFVFAIKPSTPVEIAKISLQAEKRVEKVPLNEEKNALDQVDNLLSKFVAEEVKSQLEVHPSKEIVEASADLNVKEIIVKQGDTLDKIAKSARVTVSEIMKLNRLTDTRLHIGQILFVPKGDEFAPDRSQSAVSETFSSTNSNKTEGKYYIVKHGDNPWTIAIKNGIKVEELLRLNNLDESKAKKLKPGDKLRIN